MVISFTYDVVITLSLFYACLFDKIVSWLILHKKALKKQRTKIPEILLVIIRLQHLEMVIFKNVVKKNIFVHGMFNPFIFRKMLFSLIGCMDLCINYFPPVKTFIGTRSKYSIDNQCFRMLKAVSLINLQGTV